MAPPSAHGSCSEARVGLPRQTGFTYIWVLGVVSLMGLGLVAASEVWVAADRHQRLLQAEWVASQYAAAIGRFYESSPGSVKIHPMSLEDLLEDRRSVTVRRYLRSIYRNPLTADGSWELIRESDGRVVGVRLLTEHLSRDYVYLPPTLK